MPQPRSRTSRPAQPTAEHLAHRGLDDAVGVDGAVLELVGLGVVPDVRARHGAGSGAAIGRGSPGARSDADDAVRGVLNCAATTPGVPCGATHSTLTSSSGPSTELPSQSLTRCGSPAISRAASCTLPLPPRRWGAASAGDSHCTKNGSCGSDCRPLTPICRQRSSTPSGRCRLPCTDSRPEPALDLADVVDRDHPAEPAAAELGAGPDRLAERGLVRGGVVEHLDDLDVGAGGQRQHHVAGAEAWVDAAVANSSPSSAPMPRGGALRGRRVRRRTRRGPGAYEAFSPCAAACP